MKKTIGTIILVLFFLLPGLSTATDVEGLIDTDTIWNVAGSPYIVTGNTLVASGVRLTIYPDVQVKFDGEYNLRIEGNIQAIGTPGNEILFTSNQTSPQMNDWSGLYLVNNDGSELSWIILEYSNTGIFVDAGTDNKVNNSIIRHARDGLQIAGPSIVNNMYIYDCLTGAHMFNTDSILFVDNTLENMSKGISIEGYANPTLNFNNFLEISDYSVYLPHNTDGVIDARYNYWGPATTIEMDTEGPDSNIEKIYDFYDNPTQGRVDYNNWLNAPISAPVIEVGPADLTASQGPDVQSTQLITIANSGGSLLNWNIVEDDTACDSPTDIPWLSVSPDSGTTVPLDSTDVYVIFDSTGLAPGDYTANLCVNSDDPVTPVVQVPVALTVESPVVEVEIDIIPALAPTSAPLKVVVL